uniref:Tudor domain-containing protein n=1 Tax=Spongospora subterranea TaxID=70186 RepID=A0A0H5R582_9EUKA|eukprot:CRZ09320.1 hypothetical protein [Spongospora subterranea]
MSQQSVEELAAKLAEHRQSLVSVDSLLLTKSGDETLLKLREDLLTVIEMTKNLLALRTKQEQAISQAQNRTSYSWKIGDRCSARWSQDQQWYSARITLSENNKYDVIFLDYGNTESGLSSKALRPEKQVTISDLEVEMKVRAIYEADGLFYNAVIESIDDTGLITVMFTDYSHSGQVSVDNIKLTAASKKRGASDAATSNESLDKPLIPDALKILPSDTEAQKKAKRSRIKAIKSTHRFKKLEDERVGKKSTWQTFHSAAIKKQKLGIKKESMFRSPDTVDGRVGVVGSGQAMTEFSSIGKLQVAKKEVSPPT